MGPEAGGRVLAPPRTSARTVVPGGAVTWGDPPSGEGGGEAVLLRRGGPCLVGAPLAVAGRAPPKTFSPRGPQGEKWEIALCNPECVD